MRHKTAEPVLIPDDPLWYKDAVIYEIHVRAAFDSNSDGVGDFRGLAQKLDYLQDLGVTALWLLPFYPSPLRDDGYDIATYMDVHPEYGTLQDFRRFLKAAHRRGIRVVTELVLNHTSDQHPWFQRSRRARPGTKWRDFYVWSDTPARYEQTRIIFKDFEPSNWTWDPVAGAYYWHRFYAHQPDLNFDSPHVRQAMFRIVDFWLGMGVDGLRLDAVPYLFEREGTTGENLPETHAYLKRMRRHVDQKFKNRVLLAEANQWPEDAAEYFGKGDEATLAFHFPVMPRLFMAIRQEDRFPIIDILQQTPAIPENAQWALFLRNHDELTLEMVTDEDRDYMYRMYAGDPQARINLGIRHRLAPLLDNDRRQIELMNGLLFSLPGTPVLYYGDEIGMGDNIFLGDRNGVRTPMQWSADRNGGFSRANPQRLYLPVIIDPEYHFEAVNVEAQQNNSQSLLWWVKRLIALRKQHQAFGRGEIEFLSPENRKVLAFVRSWDDERILVMANLSRFTQYVTLDLSRFAGMTPVELFGRTPFPEVPNEGWYPFSLGPHAFHWLSLRSTQADLDGGRAGRDAALPSLSVRGTWQAVFEGKARADLESVLAHALAGRRWFRGKSRSVVRVGIQETIVVPVEQGREVVMVLARVEYTEGEAETYVLPLAFAAGEHTERAREEMVSSLVARLSVRLRGGAEVEGLLYDAFGEGPFSRALIELIGRRRRLQGTAGSLGAVPTKAYKRLRGPEELPAPVLLRGEQTNSSVSYGDRLILKLFRRVEPGVNPDLELGRFLTDRTDFHHIAPVAGALEYRRGREEPLTVAVLQGFVTNEGDAWQYTLDALGRYFESVLTREGELPSVPAAPQPLLDLVGQPLPEGAEDLMAGYVESARLLGHRTAEMHTALASDHEDPAFAPEPFTPHYQRSLYQSVRGMVRQSFELLRRRRHLLAEADRKPADRVLAEEDALVAQLRQVLDEPLGALRTRTHGDYHLGQVLHTGRDFVIIDFEGEPARPLSQRRMKRSPLVDVAGMIRSFNYAATTALRQGAVRPEDVPGLLPWARCWHRWASATFLTAYLEAAGYPRWLPRRRTALHHLLSAFLLEKASYELSYELNNRPDWVGVPLRGILELIEERQDEIRDGE
ncbi:MAG: maltose alpha-D-glucosyltransferase [Thermoleophilia bacterium]|nr:maltose alpha-D-glucosyltransferase [Thermoleophilia bacterium]